MLEDGNLDALAFYIILKKQFKNGIIFDATNKRVGQLAGTSESTARKNINVLLKYDLIHRQGTDMVFVNAMKLTRYASKNGVLKASYFLILKTYKLQKIHVKSFPILCNLRTQVRMIQKVKKSTTILKQEHSNYKEFKKAKKHLDKKLFFIDYSTLSNKSFGKNINKSIPTIQRYKKTLSEQDIITVKQKFKKIDMETSYLVQLRKNNHFLDFRLNRLRIINNQVFTQLTNEYTLC
jgi:hypothetical protein